MEKLIPIAVVALLAVAPVHAAEDMITPVNWPNIISYCTFQQADASFVFEDPETWTWVYFTQHAMDGSEVGYVPINFRLRELELVGTVKGKDGETRTYRTYGSDAYDVTLTMSIDSVGYENTDYKGYLTVKGESGEETIEVKGGHGHGGGHGWGHRGGRGHHYGWSRGRGHHYGWRHHRHW